MRRLIVALIAGLLVTGCTSGSVFQGGTSLTAPVNNPVSRNNLAQVESAYGIALTAAVAYRRLPLCKAGETASLTRLCAQRGVILTLQAADRQARVAVVAARDFVRNHPTLNAVDILILAKNAVDQFRAVIDANRIT